MREEETARAGLSQEGAARNGQVDKTQAAAGRRLPAGERSRDQALVAYVGAQGAVAIEHVMAAFGLGRTAAYRRVAALVEAGLLERLEILRERPSLIRATRNGLRYAGLSLRVAAISPGSVDHWLRCASTALELRYEFAPELILSERELRQIERTEERPIFSARIRDRFSGENRLHRPDLAVLAGERPIAIEVELTPKGPLRLEAIIKGWNRAGWIEEVRYYCAPGATRLAVERTVRQVKAEERVRVMAVVPR
jgi:hypothetical protein